MFRRRLDGGPPKFQEGTLRLDPARETTNERGGGTASVRNFLSAVVQAVLIFWEETWIVLVSMSRNMEGVHVGFLRQGTGHKAKQQRDGTWRSVAAARVLEEEGT